MTLKEAHDLIDKFYDTAKDIELISNPILWALEQTALLEKSIVIKEIKEMPNDTEQIIKKWQKMYPNGKKMQCHKDTGISRPTIDKYWIENKC